MHLVRLCCNAPQQLPKTVFKKNSLDVNGICIPAFLQAHSSSKPRHAAPLMSPANKASQSPPTKNYSHPTHLTISFVPRPSNNHASHRFQLQYHTNRSTTNPTPITPTRIKHPIPTTLTMHPLPIPTIILLLLPILALTSPSPRTSITHRGCGTTQPRPASSMIGLQGNDTCNALPFEASTIRVGDGCVCHTFANDKCSYMEGSWTGFFIGPFSGDVGVGGTRWYRCAGVKKAGT
jgi:hypothetical protein